MAKKVKKEIEDWLESDVETALIELKSATDDKIELCIGEDEQKFTITYPKDYPKSKDKLVSTLFCAFFWEMILPSVPCNVCDIECILGSFFFRQKSCGLGKGIEPIC